MSKTNFLAWSSSNKVSKHSFFPTFALAFEAMAVALEAIASSKGRMPFGVRSNAFRHQVGSLRNLEMKAWDARYPQTPDLYTCRRPS